LRRVANHRLFWNTDPLARFKGETPPKAPRRQQRNLHNFDAKKWTETAHKIDEVLNAWEKAVKGADDKKLQEWASAITHIGAHNAYHTGQIIYIRRVQGSWDPRRG